MFRFLPRLWTIAVAVAVVCRATSAFGVIDISQFTFGDFEDFQFVSQNFPGNFNVTTSEGQIHNGPTPDNGPGPDSPDDVDTDPQPTPTGYPDKPGGGTNAFGNWDRGGLGGDNDDRNTGWGDWGYNSTAIFSSSTTKGVTSGSRSLRMNPQLFGGTKPNYTEHLAVKFQLMPDPLGDEAYSAFMTNKYLAVDITMDSSEWTGTGDFVQFGMNYDLGPSNLPSPDVIHAGLQRLGVYHENTADPFTEILRTPNLDTGNPSNPGFWDPVNYPGITTRTLYWDYSNWEAPPSAGQPGGPPTGQFYDFRTFAQVYGLDGDNGWLEFNSWYSYSQGFTGGYIYFDNWRLIGESGGPIGADGDFDDDNDVDAVDIDILWHIIRQTGTDPNNNDTADLNNDTFVNEDDVDLMLASKLTAGTNMAYGDANLSGGTPELTDYNLWRTGTGGWANGDFDGSGGVPELNDYNLWRTGPTEFPGSVGSHGGGGGAPLVPEPATIVLTALALPALIATARRRKR